MVNDRSNESTPKPQFKYCLQCGRKGLYHIRQQYYRCRYCGTYIISSPDQVILEKSN